jgi:hypothetical protein
MQASSEPWNPGRYGPLHPCYAFPADHNNQFRLKYQEAMPKTYAATTRVSLLRSAHSFSSFPSSKLTVRRELTL